MLPAAPPHTSGCQKRAQKPPHTAGSGGATCPQHSTEAPRHGQAPPGVGASRLLLRPGKVTEGLGGVSPALTSSRLLPGGPWGSPGLRLLSRAPATSCPWGGQEAGRGGQHGPARVLRGHRRLLKLSLARPPPLPQDTADARHGEGSAQPPRLLPGLFWEQIPFPGCKQVAWLAPGREGGSAIPGDDTRASETRNTEGTARRRRRRRWKQRGWGPPVPTLRPGGGCLTAGPI